MDYERSYKLVAANQTDVPLGVVGAKYDFVEGLLAVVATAATAQVQIRDGAGARFTVFPNSPGGGVGTYTIPLGLTSKDGPWFVTTGAGVSVIAIGVFNN